MEIQDLRIGNYVQDNSGFIFNVVSIHDDGTVYCDFKKNEGNVWEFDNNNPCQGIEITEEILLKCGFIPCSIIENNFNISGMCVWKCNDMFLCDKNGIHIKYIHQLQNLYWCLCGKELDINTTTLAF